MQILNQFSYVIISAIVLLASIVLMRRYGINRRLMSAVVGALVVFSLSSFFLLRPGVSDVDSASSMRTMIENGKPTLLEFFSNYCAGCLALRPAVDLLASDIESEFNILRIDIHTDLGREIRNQFGFTFTPEFVLFDNTGQEIWRDHTLPPREQVNALANTLRQ